MLRPSVSSFQPLPGLRIHFQQQRNAERKMGPLQRDRKTEIMGGSFPLTSARWGSKQGSPGCVPALLSATHHLHYLVGTCSDLIDGWPGSRLCSQQDGSTSVSLKT